MGFEMPLYRELSAPLMAQLEITPRCNHHCLHCYNHWRGSHGATETNKAVEPERIMKSIELLIDSGIFNIVVTGGEPLLERRLLYRVMQCLQEQRMYYSVNTNLTLLTEEDAEQFAGLGVSTVLTSLLGDTAEIHEKITGVPGSFKKVIRGIELLRSSGVRVVVNMVVNQINHKHVRAVGRLVAEDLGCTAFSATKASPPLSGIDFSDLALSPEQVLASLDDLLAIEAAHGINVQALECYPICLHGDPIKYSRFSIRNCRAGITACAISPQGDMRPCVHSDMVYGNIVNEGVNAVWVKMSDWRSGEYVPVECRECAMVKECSGGCRMEAKCYGDIAGKDPCMTKPLSGKLPLSALPDVINAETRLVFREGIVYRPEEFGAIVTRRGSSGILFVNEDGMRLLQYLASLPSFTPSEVATMKRVKVERVVSLLRRMVLNDLCAKMT